ncbi:heavy metal translocating P-type ATPase [Turicimonas muris]|uniref:heavy metal translocating P-type ATPase n=4 Tax=Turicimonas muris TaxID=1796652 RepID=UPI00248AB13C|nr:heavy metal translocating P-type ATPase [Turicimonas muris]MBS4769017.1 heavy metal translocating P-type ATPase [Burkholderiales bacterium]
MKFSVVSHTQGRIRFVSDFPFGSEGAEELADKLDLIPGIEGVRINPRTRSVLLLYMDKQSLQEAKSVIARYMRTLASKSLAIPQGQSVISDVAFWPMVRFFTRPLMPFPASLGMFLHSSWGIFSGGFKKLFSGKLTVEVLDLSAIAASLLMRDFKTASTLVLLLGFGEKLEEWTRRKTMTNLTRSLAMNIDTVWIVKDGHELEVPLSSVTKEDLLKVRAGSAIPVDGKVIGGSATVNQASMTGESIGVLRTEGSTVYAGTVVEDGELLIQPTAVGQGTRLNKIIQFIENSEKVKANVESKAMKIADKVVPYSFLLSGLVWLFTRNLQRAAAVLMVDYSCALKMSTPVAFMSSMREGASHKILIKGGRYIEELAQVDTVVFDKTGTLTESHPKVSEVIPLGTWDRDTVLRNAACLEEHFPHPVAKAIVRAAADEELHHEEEHAEVKYVVGHGICTELNGEKVLIGSRHYIEEDEGVDCSGAEEIIESIASKGHTVLYLSRNGKLEGLIGIEDPIRKESVEVIEELRNLGIQNIVMLTGDGPRTAKNVAARLDIKEYYCQVLPEGKAQIIERMVKSGRKVLMVGDGINDSPALTAANVGVSLSEAADLAREVAAVVLLENNLKHLPLAIKLGKRTLSRIHQNFRASVGLNTAFLAGGLAGVLPAAVGAVLHNVTTVGVTLNAARAYLPNLSEEERTSEVS